MEEIYYKTMTETEYLYGHQYVNGLNIQDREYDPNSTYFGSYFTFVLVKNIFQFIDGGYYLREITLPIDCLCVADPNLDHIKSDKIILGARYNLTDVLTFKMLLKKGADIHAGYDSALRWAAKNGHLEISKFLVENGADVCAYDNYALRVAFENGHTDIVKYLVDNGAEITTSDNYALRFVLKYKNFGITKYLLKNNIATSDIDKRLAFLCVCRNGWTTLAHSLYDEGHRMIFKPGDLEYMLRNKFYRMVYFILDKEMFP